MIAPHPPDLPYFAYGSNLHPRRLGERLGTIECVALARCPDRRLAFHKRGKDGSAKCDLALADVQGSAVPGVIYRIGTDHWETLDRFEGRGRGYERERVSVLLANGQSRDVLTYVASEDAIDPTLKPWKWYRDLVIEGARFHGFDTAWIDALMAVETRRDPNDTRRRENEDLLAAMRTER